MVVSAITARAAYRYCNCGNYHKHSRITGKWIRLEKQHEYPIELTAALLNTLIGKNLIHGPVNPGSGFKDQEIEIIYRFVGKLD